MPGCTTLVLGISIHTHSIQLYFMFGWIEYCLDNSIHYIAMYQHRAII